jgi:hypothetical protein
MATSAVVPYHIERQLPFAVNNQLAALPDEYQKDFVKEYSKRMKNLNLAYFFNFFGFQYLYLDKILTQLVYWFTVGGFGFWWLIDWFRISGMVETRNQQIADDCLRRVIQKYERQTGNSTTPLKAANPRNAVQAPAKPREVLTDGYDPTKLTIENLNIGFLVDYGLKTWKVVNRIQFDWNDGLSEREFKLNNENDLIYLSVRRESALVYCHISTIVNLYVIDKNFDEYVTLNGAPPTVIQYADFTLYRDHRLEGTMFNAALGNKPLKVVMWDYYDMSRDYRLRVERTVDTNQFFAIFGKKVSDIEFSEVLPVGE